MDFSQIKKIAGISLAVVVVLALVGTPVMAQRLDGTLRGEVKDPNGAVIQGANVTATNKDSGVSAKTTTSDSGTYVFPNLLVGTYTVTVESSGFSKLERSNIEVRSNQVTEAHIDMQVGAIAETVQVTAGSEMVQTESSQLSNTFSYSQLQHLPGGTNPLNLAILLPNTTANIGGTAGAGGSIGGTRPRMNNFTFDGVDDNDVSVTGPMINNYVQDAIQEFTVITNQFSAEYGHSAGGQFALVSKSGTNNWHGNAFWFMQNRRLNALDNLDKEGGVTRECARTTIDPSGCTPQSRFDRNVGGGSLGGPVWKDKLFIFGAYEKIFTGLAGAPSVASEAPTAAGIAALQSLAVNSAVSDIIDQFPVATSPTGTITVNQLNNSGAVVASAPVEIGSFVGFIPDFSDEHIFHINGDAVLGKHNLATRYLYDKVRSPLTTDNIPQAQFTGAIAYDVRKALVKDVWTINNRVVNDFVIAYTRQDGSNLTIPAQFANFPDLQVNQIVNFVVGPYSVAPQGGLSNTYQISDAISYVSGRHTWKFGAEGRKWIGKTGFLPRNRGEFDYATFDELVSDLVPSSFAKRGAGSGDFVINQSAVYLYAQDDFKVTPNLTINAGVRYEFATNPRGAETQLLNKISDLPGTPFIFDVPTTDKNNFAPRVGFAWDPTGGGKWSIRGGFGVSYDVTFQNLPLLQLPPQLQSEQDPDITCGLPSAPAWCANYAGPYPPTAQLGQGFLANGGLLQVNIPPANKFEARAATQGVMLDVVQPKIFSWSVGVQRELTPTTMVEVRYLGTDSRNLPIQVQANARTAFANGARALPMFLSASDALAANFTGTSATLAEFNGFIQRPYSQILSNLAADCAPAAPPCLTSGFLGSVTTFPTIGSGIYHAGSINLIQRAWHGAQFQANYTFARNIDNSTNELFTSSVNPRRPQDGDNIDGERGLSTLDVTHKVALSVTYELPKWGGDGGIAKALLGGWVLGGTYLYQSGQPVTIQSRRDVNGNGDSAGDRVFVNPNGTPDTGTDSGFVCFDGATVSTSASGCAGGAAETVGYYALADAEFIKARPGVVTNAGRNNVRSVGLDNLDISFFKNTRITERVNVQFRAEAFNALNHRQFSFATKDIQQIAASQGQAQGATGFIDPGSSLFLDPQQLNGGSRNIQLGVKVFF